jgi:hypothetical protein
MEETTLKRARTAYEIYKKDHIPHAKKYLEEKGLK